MLTKKRKKGLANYYTNTQRLKIDLYSFLVVFDVACEQAVGRR